MCLPFAYRNGEAMPRYAVSIMRTEVSIMINKTKQHMLGYLALAVAASIWGGMYVVSKIVLDYLPPFTLLWLRYAIGLVFLWFFVVRQGLRQPFRQDWRLFLSIGFVGYFLSVGLQFIGTWLSSAHMGAILTSASPVFIVLFAFYVLGETITGRKIAALILAMTGVIVVVGWDEQMLDGNSRSLTGNIALLGAAVTWAYLSVLAKKAAERYSPLVVTTYAIFWALWFATPAMVIEWRFLPVSGLTQPSVWCAVLYLGIVSTAGAFYLWNRGMHMVEAGARFDVFLFSAGSRRVVGLASAGRASQPFLLCGRFINFACGAFDVAARPQPPA